MSEKPRIPAGQIGRSIVRVEARAKVTGTAEYIHNLRLPGMLWAKICRSTVPHGHIRRIDASAKIGRNRFMAGERLATSTMQRRVQRAL